MAASSDNSLPDSASIAAVLNETWEPHHLQTLKKFTSALRGQEYRDAVEEESFTNLLKVLTKLCDELQAAQEDNEDLPSLDSRLQLLAECFRAQRNCCVQSTRNQNLLRELGFIDVSVHVLQLHRTLLGRTDAFVEALRCGIQFLGNIAVGNQMCKDDIWSQIFPDLLLELLSVNDDKVVNYSSMVLHTCLDEHKVADMSSPQSLQVALKVMELCRTQPDVDWAVLIATQYFLRSPALVESLYTETSHIERVTLLELMFAQLREDEECGVPPSVACFLASAFQKGCGAVLTLATGSASNDEVLQEALTVISLLDVLCEMTSDLKEFMFLQDHPDLLISTVELLKQVHNIGKASKNIFSPAQNFSSVGGDGDEDSSSQSPVVSFKAHLIRLIGNLSHNNTGNQNKVRELEGIPLVLDNCNVDSNNPFISQWAIFAIRNLLENNQQNQELVASLERRGPADYSALRELGFSVEERDGSLLLKPVRKGS